MEAVTEKLIILPLHALARDGGSSSVSDSNSNSNSDSDPTDAVVFAALSLVLGIACRHLLRGTRVPYTGALLVIGIALGSLGASIRPELLLAVFLPAFLFESSFSMELHQIKRCIGQMILLAGPGVIISTFCLGSALKLTFPYNWSWKVSLLLGGLPSATDPVAVVALLKELGTRKKLSTIIEGESLMNDGTAIVVYQLFFKMVLGESFSWDAVVEFLAKVSLGAVGMGIAYGMASILWLGFIFNDTVIEIALTLAVSYIAYYTGRPSHLALPSGNSIDRPLSRECGGLMSWPEHVFKAREQLAIPKETEQQAMSLSAKAMQLSIFGSMVEMPWHRRSLSRISPTEPSHSVPSPRVPLYRGHLVSARSEGSVIMKKNLEVRKLKCKMPPQPPRRGGEMKEDRLADYSSDESGPEDEHIIRIDSPSVLSFNQAP